MADSSSPMDPTKKSLEVFQPQHKLDLPESRKWFQRSHENSSILHYMRIPMFSFSLMLVAWFHFFGWIISLLTYPPPIIRLLSSPAINKSVVSRPFLCSPVHEYLTGLGLSLNTKLSPVPKYERVLGPEFLSAQLVATKPPKTCCVISAIFFYSKLFL